MQTLKDNHKNLTASMSYNFILFKLENSRSRTCWPFLIKVLLLLDRLVENKMFLKETANIKSEALSSVTKIQDEDCSKKN